MSWTGIRDHRNGRVLRNVTGLLESGLVARGTLLIEARHRAGQRFDQLLDVSEERDWHSGLRLTVTPGRLELEIASGPDRHRHCLTLPKLPDRAPLRITYAWNAPAQHALLTAELPSQGQIHQIEIKAPPPLSVLDLHALISGGQAAVIGGGVEGIAIGDHFERVGLAPGLTAETRIQTTRGPRRIDRLQLNDKVITASGGLMPVRWITKRSLPAIGSLAPVRIAAPVLDATEDLVVAPGTRLVVGRRDETALVAAEDISQPGRDPEPGVETTYYNLLLDEHVCIRASGLWVESLFVGTLARYPEILATTPLGVLPADAMPTHRRMTEPAPAQEGAPALVLRDRIA